MVLRGEDGFGRGSWVRGAVIECFGRGILENWTGGEGTRDYMYHIVWGVLRLTSYDANPAGILRTQCRKGFNSLDITALMK